MNRARKRKEHQRHPSLQHQPPASQYRRLLASTSEGYSPNQEPPTRSRPKAPPQDRPASTELPSVDPPAPHFPAERIASPPNRQLLQSGQDSHLGARTAVHVRKVECPQPESTCPPYARHLCSQHPQPVISVRPEPIRQAEVPAEYTGNHPVHQREVPIPSEHWNGMGSVSTHSWKLHESRRRKRHPSQFSQLSPELDDVRDPFRKA